MGWCSEALCGGAWVGWWGVARGAIVRWCVGQRGWILLRLVWLVWSDGVVGCYVLWVTAHGVVLWVAVRRSVVACSKRTLP